MSPEEYSCAVREHSKQSITASLYPGDNFDKLAIFLNKPYPTKTPRGTNSVISNDAFDFITIFELFSTLIKRGPDCRSPEHLTQLLHPQSDNHLSSISRLVFLKGQPSSQWLSTIGATFTVDPEFFQRHLRYYSTIGRPNYFSLPSLPSVSNEFITLRVVSLGQRNGYERLELESLRKRCGKFLSEYNHSLGLDLNIGGGLGRSILRDFSIYKGHVVIEQEISICVTHQDNFHTGETADVLSFYDCC